MITDQRIWVRTALAVAVRQRTLLLTNTYTYRYWLFITPRLTSLPCRLYFRCRCRRTELRGRMVCSKPHTRGCRRERQRRLLSGPRHAIFFVTGVSLPTRRRPPPFRKQSRASNPSSAMGRRDVKIVTDADGQPHAIARSSTASADATRAPPADGTTRPTGGRLSSRPAR
jgi:hypothetical protein